MPARPLTVALLSRAVSPDAHSGIGRATLALAAGLAEAGHTVHLLTRPAGAPVVRADGVALHALVVPPVPPSAALAAEPVVDHLAHAAAVHRAIVALNERQPLDAVVAPLWGCEGVVALLDDRLATVVSCMTSMTTIRELSDAPATRHEEQLAALERATLRRARYVHGLTRHVLHKTLADYGIVPEEAAVVGRGLADRAGDQRAGGATGPHASAVGILFVGRLETRKGVDVLLEAARRLAADGVDFTLTLAGPDSLEAGGVSYRSSFDAGDPELARRVRFAGAVADPDLDRLYREADLVCAPSRYESHGIVLVEAMMYGKPIVASAAGGIPEVLEADQNALLVPPGDPAALAAALRRAADDRELRERFGSRSRALYEERFASAVVAGRMAELLARVAARHERAAGPPPDLVQRLAAVVEEVLGSGAPAAEELAAELLRPSAEAWRQAALDAERERAAWQARALEAERQRAAAEETAAALANSRSWRVTGPLRRAASFGALRAARRRVSGR